MVYNIPIVIEKKDEKTEKWTLFGNFHARINKNSGSEHLNAGAVRSQNTRVFEVRYTKMLEEIALNTQLFRVVYRGNTYNITDYDDYLEQHRNVKLLGVSY